MTATVWTEDRVSRLRRLWRDGWTAARIAAEFGPSISRSAVLGKVHRLGLSADRPRRSGRRQEMGCPAAEAAPAARRPGETLSDGSGSSKLRSRPEAGLSPRPPQTADLPSGGLGLLDLRRGQCRWPYGPDRGVTTFCGRPVSRGAYCRGHAGVGYSTLGKTQPSLLALAGLESDGLLDFQRHLALGSTPEDA
jgi:GcrA cell cycle regulator